MGSYVTRYVTDVMDLNAWIRHLPLYKRLPVLALSTLTMFLVIYDYSAITAYPGGSFVIALSALCFILAPFWIGYDAVNWFFRYGFQRGAPTRMNII